MAHDLPSPTRLTGLGAVVHAHPSASPPARRLQGLIAAVGEPVARVGVPLLRCSGRRLGLALVYHRVSPRTDDARRELVPAHSAALLERQLTHLRRRYRIVGAADLLAAVRCRRRGQRFPVALTFDDDSCTHAAHAAPILRRFGAPATFFLSGGHLDPPFRYWWESGEEPAMSAEDVSALAAGGFAVGFHTLRHEKLPPLDEDELRQAVSDGRERIAALFGRPLVAISYPHGLADARVARVSGEAGFALGFTGETVAVKVESDPMLLGRVEPSLLSAGHLALRLLVTLIRGVPGGRPVS